MQIQEAFLFCCVFHAWLYSCKMKRCGSSHLFSFRQGLEVLAVKHHQPKMVKPHRFGLDVQTGIGRKEPGFQMWWTGSSSYSASQKLGVLSWWFQGFARHIWAPNILQIVGCGGEENAQKSWQISWRWYLLSQRKVKIMLQKPKTEIMKNFYVI